MVINGQRMVSGSLNSTSIDQEGDASTIIKAFCNLPLSYEEYTWIEKNAPSFLPDLTKMTERERSIHKVQTLQLNLQKIQAIEERQALGNILTEEEMSVINKRSAISDELAVLKFNMTMEEIRSIKNMDGGYESEGSNSDSEERDLVLPESDSEKEGAK